MLVYRETNVTEDATNEKLSVRNLWPRIRILHFWFQLKIKAITFWMICIYSANIWVKYWCEQFKSEFELIIYETRCFWTFKSAIIVSPIKTKWSNFTSYRACWSRRRGSHKSYLFCLIFQQSWAWPWQADYNNNPLPCFTISQTLLKWGYSSPSKA